MMQSRYEDLYRFQDDALGVLRGIDTDFYLTGGTAASRAYLHHRFSEDLDLFVNDDQKFGLWGERVIQNLAENRGWATSVSLKDHRFIRIFLERQELTLKVELVNDVPAHVGEITSHPTFGRIDSAENILANKISALIDREEPKDLADIWGFCRLLGLSIAHALEGAQGKAAGLFQADVARVLLSATETDWRAIRWLEPPPADLFLADLRYLGTQLVLGQ